jgi:hypothetical protein
MVEFCGLVANYRVFKSDPKKYITFATLGTGNGRYLDVVFNHAISLHESPIVWGLGKLGYKNNTEYVIINRHKQFKYEDLEHIK